MVLLLARRRRRMCPPAFEIEKDFAGGMCLGDDHAAEWDGQSPRPRKLVPGTLGAVGVGAGPIGKTTFTAGENFHGKGDGQLDQQARTARRASVSPASDVALHLRGCSVAARSSVG